MQKVSFFLIVFLVFLLNTSFYKNGTEKVQWITIKELQAAYTKTPKPILIDVYTNWCGWCKVMDKETYGKENVAAYINEHYYAIKLDAELKETIEWNGKKYGYNAPYKSNDLAIYLLNGQMSFPTTVFLSGLNAQPAPLPGYLKPKEIEPPLKFFGEGAFKTKNFPEFMKTFSASW
jgi:thioredoxin-related protein